MAQLVLGFIAGIVIPLLLFYWGQRAGVLLIAQSKHDPIGDLLFYTADSVVVTVDAQPVTDPVEFQVFIKNAGLKDIEWSGGNDPGTAHLRPGVTIGLPGRCRLAKLLCTDVPSDATQAIGARFSAGRRLEVDLDLLNCGATIVLDLLLFNARGVDSLDVRVRGRGVKGVRTTRSTLLGGWSFQVFRFICKIWVGAVAAFFVLAWGTGLFSPWLLEIANRDPVVWTVLVALAGVLTLVGGNLIERWTWHRLGFQHGVRIGSATRQSRRLVQVAGELGE